MIVNLVVACGSVRKISQLHSILSEILIKTNGTATYKGKLTTKKLTAKSITFGGAPDPNVGTIFPVEDKKLEGISRIQNLEVKTINGIDWNDFYGSLYLKDSPQPIDGTITSRLFDLIFIVPNYQAI